jgi:hypothetical protein
MINSFYRLLTIVFLSISARTFLRSLADKTNNFLKMEIKSRETYCYVTNSKLEGVNDKKMYPGDLKIITARNLPL